MNIEQQPKDRFDRSIETDVLPEPDLAAAIAGGRRSRRRRSMSYAVGSLAVAAVAATAFGLAGPHAQTVPDGGSFAGAPATDYVAGTTIDTDLAAAIAAADPTLPAPTSVQPIDPATETGLPVALFGPPATGWMLTYEVNAGAHVSIMVSSDVPERSPSCPDGGTVSSTADGVSVCKDDRIITDANEPGPAQLSVSSGTSSPTGPASSSSSSATSSKPRGVASTGRGGRSATTRPRPSWMPRVWSPGPVVRPRSIAEVPRQPLSSPLPRAVAVLERDGKVLVIRRHLDGRDYAVLPGGGVEDGETPEQAVIRELAEECTLDGEVAELLHEGDHGGRHAWYFRVTGVEGEPVPPVPASEKSGKR